jgi:hypothetical protein
MKPIEDVIAELTPAWLGRKGVVGIASEEKDGEQRVIFTVDTHPIQRLDYPIRASGYPVIVRPPRESKRWDEWVRTYR